MKPQEIELWGRDIVDSVLNGQPVEDSIVELKAKWLEAEKAAPRLGGHANASRGENILWLIGVDERNSYLTNVDATEKGDWYKAVEKCFDGFAPRLLDDVNFKVNENAIVALYFDTATEAPFVVKNPKGGFPEYIVPWREGTDLRATRRENLLRILLPVYSFRSLLSELEFNLEIAEIPNRQDGYQFFGSLFRDEVFSIALNKGVFENLNNRVKELLFQAYIFTNRANQKIQGSMGVTNVDMRNEAFLSVKDSLGKISAAHSALRAYIKNGS